jgi:uncharacterized protein YdiU (UPF0061 family)
MLDFANLGGSFFSEISTQPLANSFLIHQNRTLQNRLSIDDKTLFAVASGSKKFQQTQPIASVYAGHQFGHFVGQLGDGRSCLIGQTNGFELSLKGAGQTPYSRGADGRAVLRSSIREYLCSIAMVGLNIPTTQALALMGSETEVCRENIETAAIVMRAAQSHIRFGQFELFSSRAQFAQVKQLADFVIEQYFPALQGKNRYVDFLAEVVKRTAKMISLWQAQGFAHGVMNTDNMSILGLTLDYGPFGFLENYNPQWVCNHSDAEARYAFDQQPGVALWNLSRLADSLSSLMSAKQAKSALELYQPALVKSYSKLMRQKFGLSQKDEQDNVLISQFFELLRTHKKDYTNTFRALSEVDKFANDSDFSTWLEVYHTRLAQEKNPHKIKLMNAVNPNYILRNYLAEIAIRKAQDEQDYQEIEVLFKLLAQPFSEQQGFEKYTQTTPDWAQNLSVSCSS